MSIEDEILALLRRKQMSPFDPGILEEHSRFILNNYLQKAQVLLDQFSGQPGLKMPLVIKLCVTDPVFVRAFVAPLAADHHYVVTISYGVFANLYACFMGLLSHPEILPHIGRPQDTFCRYTIATYGLLDFTYENEPVRAATAVKNGFPLWNYPKDPHRLLYALLLTDIAIQFILYHEWGHILGGHVDYANREMHVFDLAEIAENIPVHNGKALNGRPVRMAIEFEADYIATTMIAGLATSLPDHKRTYFQAYPADFLATFDVRDAIYFAMMSLFHLFEEVQQKYRLPQSKLYPSPFNRFASLLFSVEGNAAWNDYAYQGVQDFAKVSQLLQFDFLFSDHIYDDEKRKKEIIALDELLKAVRVEMGDYRLSR